MIKKFVILSIVLCILVSCKGFGHQSLLKSIRPRIKTNLSSMKFVGHVNKCGEPCIVKITQLNSGVDTAIPEETKPPTALQSIPKKIVKKLLPLGLMLFFILFNYTILRDTKDVLVVTAPNSGAEIIPFLKTYVNLPSAIGFTLLYSSLCNKMPPDKVFYLVMTAFLTFFGAFASIICK